MKNSDNCLCGNTASFENCCGKYLEQGAYPITAEALMRSRYSAYVRHDKTYLIKTWHPNYCPELSETELKNTHWVRLDVIKTKSGLKRATVEFKAYYLKDQSETCLHEISIFKKIKNRWVYLHEENFTNIQRSS